MEGLTVVKRPTTERGRQTRQRIVTAARNVVSEKGVAAASLDEVGSRAAASRSQLYHYFADKDELLLAVAEATIDVVLDGQRALFDGLGSWSGLAQWTDSLVKMQMQLGGRGGGPMANLVTQLVDRDADFRKEPASVFDACKPRFDKP